MVVKQKDVSVEMAVKYTPARGFVSETSDSKLS